MQFHRLISSPGVLAVGDPGRTRTVYAVIALLAVIGIVMVMLAVWLIRTTRRDLEVLGPLERMADRKWRRADVVVQRRLLEEVRPPGARPLRPVPPPPRTDTSFGQVSSVIGFDDLRDELIASDVQFPPGSGVEVLPPLAPPPADAEPADLAAPSDDVDRPEEPAAPDPLMVVLAPPTGAAVDAPPPEPKPDVVEANEAEPDADDVADADDGADAAVDAAVDAASADHDGVEADDAVADGAVADPDVADDDVDRDDVADVDDVDEGDETDADDDQAVRHGSP